MLRVAVLTGLSEEHQCAGKKKSTCGKRCCSDVQKRKIKGLRGQLSPPKQTRMKQKRTRPTPTWRFYSIAMFNQHRLRTQERVQQIPHSFLHQEIKLIMLQLGIQRLLTVFISYFIFHDALKSIIVVQTCNFNLCLHFLCRQTGHAGVCVLHTVIHKHAEPQ